MIHNNYPYTNSHNLNLDWILEQVQKQSELTEGILTERIKNIINEHFNTLIPEMAYDEETETLTFKLVEKENNNG